MEIVVKILSSTVFRSFCCLEREQRAKRTPPGFLVFPMLEAALTSLKMPWMICIPTFL